MEFEPLLSLISRVILVIGIGLVALFGPRETMESTGFILVFLIIAFSQATRAVIGMMIAAKFLKSYRIQWSLAVAKELFRHSWIMGIATFCTGLSLRIDLFFLKAYRTSEEVALFHIPHMYTLQIQILAVSVVTALFPLLSRWGSNRDDDERFRSAQDMSIRFMTCFGLLLAVVSVLFPGIIIRILAGSAYLDAIPAMVLLSWCIPILFLNYLGANLLTAIKKQNLLIIGAVFSLLLNGLLDYLWVPRYGTIGASIATLLAYGLQVVIVFALLRKYGRNRIHAFSAIGLPVLSCLSVVAAVSLVEWMTDADSTTSALIRTLALLTTTVLLGMIQPVSLRELLQQIKNRRQRLR